MNEIDQAKNNTNKQNHNKIHLVLMGSYLIFFFAVIFGVFLDLFVDKEIFSNYFYKNIGFLMLIIGSLVIFWAQKTSSPSKHKIEEGTSPYLYFEFGPYRYLRSPTHFGLFIVTLGFSLIINSFFGVLLNIFSYLIIRFFVFKEEEKLLAIKYGQVYTDYKKKIKNWI